jgi:hypothetical protein
MCAKSALLLLMMAQAQAFAITFEGSDPPAKKTVVCERLLNKEFAENQLNRDFLGRPFVIWTVHEMTDEGMRKMSLDPNSSDRALKDLVLISERSTDRKTLIVKLNRYANQAFKTIQRFEFTEPVLKSYRPIRLPEDHWKYSLDQLQEEYPDPIDLEDDFNFHVGYQTEADPDGVRRFIVFSKAPGIGGISGGISITFGLDVPLPYNIARKYSPDLVEVTDELRTPSGHWRRIAVLRFARMD